MPAVLEKWDYPISVGQPSQNESCKVGLNIKNQLVKSIATNLFGKIEGAVEPGGKSYWMRFYMSSFCGFQIGTLYWEVIGNSETTEI